MANQDAPQTERDRVLATITRLVTAADGDTLYRDVYLHRAAELLSPIVTEQNYAASLGSRASSRGCSRSAHRRHIAGLAEGARGRARRDPATIARRPQSAARGRRTVYAASPTV
jgi:hypothetical protein